jgi:hypothetical protein
MINLDELESYDLENTNGEFINKKIIKTKFRFLELFDQKYNIVIYIRESNIRTNHFRKLIKKMNSINNRTKWNN